MTTVLPLPRVRRSTASPADELAATLRGRVGGGVRFDAGTRALYATDASNYRQPGAGGCVAPDLSTPGHGLRLNQQRAEPYRIA